MELMVWYIIGFIVLTAALYFFIYKGPGKKSSLITENNSFYVFMGVSVVLAIIVLILGATVR